MNQEQGSAQNQTYQEIAVIQYIRNLESTPSVEQNENQEEFNIYDYKDQANLNMDFFGIDLSQVPTQNLTNWKVLIIPVLYVISSFVSIKLTTSINNKKKQEKDKKLITDGNEENKEEYNPMEDANKKMSWFMPLISISIAIVAPLGLALYWLMNNILMIIERLVLNKIFDKEEEADENA